MNYWWNYWCQVCSWPILALGPLEHRLLRWAGTCPGAALWLDRKLPYSYQFDPICDVSFRATVCYRMLQGPFVPSKPWSLYARREVLELVGTSIFVLLWAVPSKAQLSKVFDCLGGGSAAILIRLISRWTFHFASQLVRLRMFRYIESSFHVLNEVPGLSDLDLIFDWWWLV